MKNISRRGIVSGKIYHILNRGVDNRTLFLEKEDYFRFVHDLFEFNNKEVVLNLGYFFQSIDLRNQYVKKEVKKPRKLIVKILAFCLMPNHFHLLIKQKEEGGITKFMRKLSVGYANYFNQKYERTGALFQGRFKAVPVNKQSHFIHLPYYIHLNPLDLTEPQWRQREIKDYKKAVKFLKSYRWSSFLDYIGKKNFPSVTQREFLLNFFGGEKEYKRTTFKWLKELNLEELKEVIME